MLETIRNIADPEYLMSRLSHVCDSVSIEKNGNIIAYIKGTSHQAPLMIATHTDLPHFLCMGTEDEKVFLQYVGNFKGDKWENCCIVSEKGIQATISQDEEKLFAIIDGENGEVSPGDIFYVLTSPEYTDGNIATYGISSTAPAAALLLTAEKVSVHRPLRDVYFAFTAEGQYGYKLYSSAAKKCGATEAVCIGCIDEKESEKVTVRLCDRSFSSDKKLSDKLISVGAESIAIREGRCASGTVQLWGIPTAELDLPVSHLGKLTENVKESDICSIADILTKFFNK